MAKLKNVLQLGEKNSQARAFEILGGGGRPSDTVEGRRRGDSNAAS